jgi:hypothetical protein
VLEVIGKVKATTSSESSALRCCSGAGEDVATMELGNGCDDDVVTLATHI